MHFQQLHLIQFRNYTEQQLTFSPDINVLTGPNGAGKTNVLDALHYLAFTKGFRNTQDQQAVQRGAQFFFDGGVLIRENRKRQVHCNYQKGKGKKLLINQEPLKKMSEHIGYIPMVSILPHDTDLINGPSAGRRQFMDMLISQYDPMYLQQLIQYNRILGQRNALLRQFGEQRYFDPEQLALWDMQLIPRGLAIHSGREAFIERFLPIFEQYFHHIVSDMEMPHIRYKPSVPQATAVGWETALQEKLERDRVNQYSGVGVHRDDMGFEIDERSVRNFGSQGQQKTFIIALKLAQYKLLQEQRALAPILLLDDIFDKLDEKRLARIAQMLDEEVQGQIFITDTSQRRMQEIFAQSQRQVKFFQVKSGEIHSLMEEKES
ncbi:MAG: DNA replication/repair protein RecF [Bacteroidota bacterium]